MRESRQVVLDELGHRRFGVVRRRQRAAAAAVTAAATTITTTCTTSTTTSICITAAATTITTTCTTSTTASICITAAAAWCSLKVAKSPAHELDLCRPEHEAGCWQDEVGGRDCRDEHQPEPDDDEYLLVEQVDCQRTLHDVVVNTRLVMNLWRTAFRSSAAQISSPWKGRRYAVCCDNAHP